LLVVLLLGAAVARLAVFAAWRVAVAAVAVAGPLVLLPDAAHTVHPTLQPVHYPADWAWARKTVGHAGDVAVLPFQSYRQFSWTGGRTVLDPAPRLLPGDVVVSDQLAVSGRALRGEDDRVREVAAALGAGPSLPRDLAAAGIGWVLVEHATPGGVPDLAGLAPVRAGPDLTLYRVPGRIDGAGPSGAQITVVIVGDAVAVVTVIFAAAALLLDRRKQLVGFSH
jgi:hypothetical protein